MKTELCGPLRPPHRPAACYWSSIPAPDRRRMSPDRKHRQSHRRRPCRTHCPDRKAWAASHHRAPRKVVGNARIALARAVVTAFRRPRKVPRRYPRPQQAPPTWKCSPPCGPGRARRFTVRGCSAGCCASLRCGVCPGVSRSRGFFSGCGVCTAISSRSLVTYSTCCRDASAAACCGGACTSVADRSRSPRPVSVVPKSISNPSPGSSSPRPHIERHEQESRRDRQRIKQSCEARPTTRVRFIVIRIVIIHRSILTRKTPQGGIPRVSLWAR